MATHRDTVPESHPFTITTAQTPESPFASGPYTDVPATPGDPREEQPADNAQAFTFLVKALLFVFFLILCMAPDHPGWIAAVFAGLLATLVTTKWVRYLRRQAREF